MTFAIGRRRLTLSFRVEPVRSAKPMSLDIPEAIAATDAELARLGRHAAELDRLRWESELDLLTYRPLV